MKCKFLWFVALAVSGCAPSLPDNAGHVPSSQGGLLLDHVEVIAAHDGPVILNGSYVSAATLWLGADDACVTPDARFGFHSPSSYGRQLKADTYARAVRLIASHYPNPLADWYRDRFAQQSRDMVWIDGSTLIAQGVAKSC